MKFVLSVAILVLSAAAVQTNSAATLKKNVPAVVPVPLGTLSPAFDWIRNDKIRCMYGYQGEWKETDLLDHCVRTGFNTLVYHTMSKVHTEAGFLEEARQWARVQRERKLHVFVGMPFGSDERYGNTQFGSYQPGVSKWTHTPCPASAEYWDRVVGDRAVVAARDKLTGVVVDMEMYGGDSTRYVGPCYCDACWSRFAAEYLSKPPSAASDPAARRAFITDHGLFREYSRAQELRVSAILRGIERRVHAVNPDFILSYMLDVEPLAGLARGFGTPAMPCLIFSELEYPGVITGVADRVEYLRKLGYPALYVPGFWIQPVTPPQLPGLARSAASLGAGYWIWTLGAFMPWAKGEYAHAAAFSHDDYWRAFAETNRQLKTKGPPAPTTKPKVPMIRVPRVGHEPKSDADWSTAVDFGPLRVAKTGASAPVATSVKALWDSHRLYLQIICHESNPIKPPGPLAHDVVRIWLSDSIEIFWKRPDRAAYAHVLVSSAGTKATLLAEDLKAEDCGWNPDVRVQCRTLAKQWQLTIAIPLDQDGQGAVLPGSTLQFQVARNRQSGTDTSAWATFRGMYKASPDLWGVVILE